MGPSWVLAWWLPLVSANQFCMKDTDLLKLIELIPALAPFKPAIDKIIKDIGKSGGPAPFERAS